MKRVELSDGTVEKEFLPEKKGELAFSRRTIDVISRGLWAVVNEPGGTGARARIPNADVCGKTGTSQVVSLSKDARIRRLKKLSAIHKDHALFACYAPMKSPEIVVAVIAENAGGGGAVAAPIARQILNAYFEGKQKSKAPQVAVYPLPAGVSANGVTPE